MNTMPSLIAALISLCIITANAQSSSNLPAEQDAITIISTHEDIRASLYKIIHITPGSQNQEDGFIRENVIRVTAFAPSSAGQPTRSIRHYLMYYSEEYGWFIEAQRSDARGVYIEISSQKKGRVFIR